MSFLIWKIKVYSEAVIYFWTKRGSISNSYRACFNNLQQPIFVGTQWKAWVLAEFGGWIEATETSTST